METILGTILLIFVIIIFSRNPKKLEKFLDKMSDWINKHK